MNIEWVLAQVSSEGNFGPHHYDHSPHRTLKTKYLKDKSVLVCYEQAVIRSLMLYVQHWKFKPGYHQKGAEKFLATGAPYPGVKSFSRYHAPGSLEGWIVVETDDPKALYEHAAEWAEFLDWETTPVFTDEEAGPICAKIYS